MKYICCRRCHEEHDRAKQPMGNYERLSIAISDDKTELTIWCNRHGCMVAIIGIEGHFRVTPQGVSGQKTYITGPVI